MYVSAPHFLLLLNNRIMFHYMDMLCFVNLSVDGYLNYFNFWAVVNAANENPCTSFNVTYVFNSLGSTPKRGIAGSYAVPCSTF